MSDEQVKKTVLPPKPPKKSNELLVVLGVTITILLSFVVFVSAVSFVTFAMRCAWEAGA